MKTRFSPWRVAAIFALASLTGVASADPIRTFTGYDANTLPANDDGSVGPVGIGFGINFFGSNYSNLWVNNNGNVTFTGALSTFTPFSLLSTSTPIIAAFFADVDTRAAGSNPVTYGTGILGGHSAFASNYLHVGVYNSIPIFNTFQLLLIDRSETGAGNFDFEFNYTTINWETGTASNGNSSGLGGNSARAGYSNGIAASFEIAGSAINGAFLDTNLSTGLIYKQLGTPFDLANMNGRYDFQVRNGQVLPPSNGAVPEPSTYGLVAGLGLAALVIARRKR